MNLMNECPSVGLVGGPSSLASPLLFFPLSPLSVRKQKTPAKKVSILPRDDDGTYFGPVPLNLF